RGLIRLMSSFATSARKKSLRTILDRSMFFWSGGIDSTCLLISLLKAGARGRAAAPGGLDNQRQAGSSVSGNARAEGPPTIRSFLKSLSFSVSKQTAQVGI